MYLGRIVEIGPAEDVLLNPFHPYTKALLDVVPEAGGLERPILAGEPPDPTRIPEGCRFHPRCPVVSSGKAAELGIEARCRGEDLQLEELAPEHLAACYAGTRGHRRPPRRRSASARRARQRGLSPAGIAVLLLRSPGSLPSRYPTPARPRGVSLVLRGGQQGAQVGLGHLRTRLELTVLVGERPRARATASSRVWRAPRELLAGGAQAGSELGRLATQLDHPVDDGPAHIRIRGAARRRRTRRGPSRASGWRVPCEAGGPRPPSRRHRPGGRRATGRNPSQVPAACARSGPEPRAPWTARRGTPAPDRSPPG